MKALLKETITAREWFIVLFLICAMVTLIVISEISARRAFSQALLKEIESQEKSGR